MSHKKLILIADDEVAIHDSLRLYLQREGYAGILRLSWHRRDGSLSAHAARSGDSGYHDAWPQRHGGVR